MKVLVFGNSGSGKSTYARALAEREGIAHLDLDSVVWEPNQIAVVRSPEAIYQSLEQFLARHETWVIEGCYGELVEAAAPQCTQLVFLNPGLDACLANNERRPWEPHKYASPEQQDAMLATLRVWVTDYYQRADQWSYQAHRRIFDAHTGAKIEHTTVLDFLDRAQKTHDSYDRVAGQYLEGSRDRSLLRPWMRRFTELLPSSGPILDLGAGPCLDSAELRSLGLRVISVDRSRPMLIAARQEIPGPRVQADMRQLPFRSNCIAGVWACASLLHLDRDELVPALSGIRDVLVSSGVLFVSLKYGSGEAWDTSKFGPDAPRWFTYWSDEDLDGSLGSAGFEIVESATEQGLRNAWIARIVRRRARP